MVKIELCGLCADGHLHLITDKGKKLKNDSGENKEDFRQRFHTGMFQHESFEENSDTAVLVNLKSTFVVLHPTHCPRKKFEFLESENPDQVPDNVGRFESNENYFTHPVVYLRKFESPPPGDKHRFKRQTEQQCKKSFYRLIEGEEFTLTSEQLKTISYSELTQRFLRQFWSCHIQKDLYNSRVRKVEENEDLRVVIIQWIWCVTYSTTYLSQELVRDMKKHFPENMNVVQQVLKRHAKGVSSWSNFQRQLFIVYEHVLIRRAEEKAAERRKVKYQLGAIAVVVTSVAAMCLVRDYDRHMDFLRSIFE
ncbi:uncharacterized protein LOC135843743 [Planococcus citri]|uniref:uncharacterized protein LOC135843743 n=1 Tax=Planococcus citri TaxID=170843 RepID=UPI0031FA15F9